MFWCDWDLLAEEDGFAGFVKVANAMVAQGLV